MTRLAISFWVSSSGKGSGGGRFVSSKDLVTTVRRPSKSSPTPPHDVRLQGCFDRFRSARINLATSYFGAALTM